MAVASAGPYAMLTPFDLLQGLPLRATHGFTSHSTHPQSSSLHGTVKAGSLSETQKSLLPELQFSIHSIIKNKPFGFLCHTCLHTTCSSRHAKQQHQSVLNETVIIKQHNSHEHTDGKLFFQQSPSIRCTFSIFNF